MYEKFFGLDDLPFDGLPDNRFYFVGNCQHQALELLTSNLSRNGAICILSGPSGAGKTTLVRMLIRSLPKRMRIIAIDDPRLDEHMLLATILRASGVVATSFESIAELTLKLRRFLEKSVESGIVTTVILDEAQGLADEVIEQIRLISNIEGDLGKMINFLLVGQEDLIENIQKPMHKMFWGRVKAFASLKPLKRDEVHSYVNFRMQIAGCHDPVFTSNAINVLFKETRGLPRIINAVCDRALCIAFDAQKKTVSGHMIKNAVEVVRHRRSLFTLGLKNFSKQLALMFFAKLPLIGAGCLISIATFVLAYKYLPGHMDSLAMQSMLQKDQVIHQEFSKAINTMMPGRNPKNRAVAMFNNSLKEAVFKSDAIGSLINVWGYARADGTKASCRDLTSLKLQCVVVQQDLPFIKVINRPAVLSMRNDEMMPYYLVLHSYSDEVSTVIIGNRMYKVKTEFLRHAYDGEITYIGSQYDSSSFDGSISAANYMKAYKRLSTEVSELPEVVISDSKTLKKNYETVVSMVDEDVGYALYDNALRVGPYLEKKSRA